MCLAAPQNEDPLRRPAGLSASYPRQSVAGGKKRGTSFAVTRVTFFRLSNGEGLPQRRRETNGNVNVKYARLKGKAGGRYKRNGLFNRKEPAGRGRYQRRDQSVETPTFFSWDAAGFAVVEDLARSR